RTPLRRAFHFAPHNRRFAPPRKAKADSCIVAATGATAPADRHFHRHFLRCHLETLHKILYK
ncbi:hypothetical protein, partial [Burkholderia pseudomallei]|uniref:hypothetical protein n=1 Tax=Burkholderia pseudomallei TaxID=28450 RepID=UPI00195D659A